ncbi:MAG: hypothetical protein ACLS31_00475 [Oscillospiraceae bacterium]|nr:hypothetical protein [Ruminococcus sp.]
MGEITSVNDNITGMGSCFKESAVQRALSAKPGKEGYYEEIKTHRSLNGCGTGCCQYDSFCSTARFCGRG